MHTKNRISFASQIEACRQKHAEESSDPADEFFETTRVADRPNRHCKICENALKIDTNGLHIQFWNHLSLEVFL